jgi:hypothetical protein
MTARTTLAFLLFAALLCLGACGDDDPVVPPVITPPGHATPDHLVVALRQAYEDMDPGIYGGVLHADYTMLLSPETTQEFPQVGATLDRDAEMRIAMRMFAGLPVSDSDGNLVPGISNVSFQTLDPQGDWAEVPAGAPFAGSQAGLFDVVILCDRPGYSTLKVEGQLQLFAAASDTTIGGQDFTYWQLSGMRDLTGYLVKDVATSSLGSVKAMFWVAE